MKKPIGAQALLAGIVMAISQMSVADGFDGSELLVCAAGQAQNCTRDGNCVFSSPEAVNMPTFIEVEFEQNQISDTMDVEGERTSSIEHKKITDNEMDLNIILRWLATSAAKAGRLEDIPANMFKTVMSKIDAGIKAKAKK